jgi:hypothetical protein
MQPGSSGGLVEIAEDPKDTAVREGRPAIYRPKEIEHLITFEPMVGSARCRMTGRGGLDLVGAVRFTRAGQ